MNDQEIYSRTDEEVFTIEETLCAKFTTEQHDYIRKTLEYWYRVGNCDGYKEGVTEKGETA